MRLQYFIKLCAISEITTICIMAREAVYRIPGIYLIAFEVGKALKSMIFYSMASEKKLPFKKNTKSSALIDLCIANENFPIMILFYYSLN